MTADICLTACHFTLAGAGWRQPPRWPLKDRLTAAAQAGFAGVGLRWPDVLDCCRQGTSINELARIITDLGLEVHELESVRGWYLASAAGREGRRAEDELYGFADVLGGRHVTVVAEFEGPLPELPRMADRFRELCTRAARHGLIAALEFVPQVTALKDLPTAATVVAAAGSANGGVLLDSWHLYHSGGTPDDVRALPAGSVVAIQLNDGPATAASSRTATTFERELPGQGSFDLTGLIRSVRETGFDGPFGVEIFHPDFHALPLQTAADSAYRSARSIVAAAAESPAPVGEPREQGDDHDYRLRRR
jgi:sugar phosphate isomerase/epimerase